NFERLDFTNQAIVERYLPHVGIFLEYLEIHKQQAPLKLSNRSTASLCNCYAWYFYCYGQYVKAEKYNVYSKDICESVKDIGQDLLAASYNDLAVLYRSKGKHTEAE